MSDDVEYSIKKCSGIKELRSNGNLQEPWSESVQPVIKRIEERFERLQFTEKRIIVDESVKTAEITTLMDYAKRMFPSLDVNKVSVIKRQY